MKLNSVFLAFSLGTTVAYAGADFAPAHGLVTRQFHGGNRGQGKGAGQQANRGNAGAQGANNNTQTTGGNAAQDNNNNNNNNGGQGNANAGSGNGGQVVLDPSIIQSAATTNGLISTSANTTAPSLISTNNFADFCVGKTITNGQQNKAGSCNPSPMGSILASNKFPSAKFQSPKNGDTIAANQDFTVQLQVANIALGTFTEPTTTYYLAPAQVDNSGQLIGHTHVVIQPIDSLDSTTVRDSTQFAFFKGINDAGNGKGLVQVTVPGGLPAGTYTIGSLNSASNHQPPLPSVAQRGVGDDLIYITVADGAAGNNAGNNAGNAAGNNPGNNNAAQQTTAAAAGNGAQATQQSTAAAGNGAQTGGQGQKGQGRGGRQGGRGRRLR